MGRTWSVFACDDKQEALKVLSREAIAAVVLEPALDDGDGWAVLAAVRSTPSLRQMPVIVCSSLDDRRRGYEMGATAYLIKPTSPRELEHSLHQVLDAESEYPAST